MTFWMQIGLTGIVWRYKCQHWLVSIDGYLLHDFEFNFKILIVNCNFVNLSFALTVWLLIIFNNDKSPIFSVVVKYELFVLAHFSSDAVLTYSLSVFNKKR